MALSNPPSKQGLGLTDGADPPVRHGSEEDHCCGQGIFFCVPRTLPRFLHACSHDPDGTAVPSTQSWHDQHIWKVIGLPRAI